ncbi:MAG: hypothetical protein ACYDDU_00725 [Dermatophilaceae bacterium]
MFDTTRATSSRPRFGRPAKLVLTVAAQGVHGACVSAVAQDKSTVGRDHGAAASEAAHTCAKGSDAVVGEAKGAEKSAAGEAKGAEKSEAGEAKGAEKSEAGEAHGRG